MNDSRVYISIYITGSEGGETCLIKILPAVNKCNLEYTADLLDKAWGYRWLYNYHDKKWLHYIISLGIPNN